MRILIIYFIIFVTFSWTSSSAQEKALWNLERCYKEAKNNNFNLLRANITKEQSAVDRNTARNAFLPEVSGGVRVAGNSGLFIDPATNTLTRDLNTNSHSFLLVDVNLFSGLKNHYELKIRDLNRDNAELQYKKQLNEVYLEVTVRYYEVLYTREQFKNIKERLAQLDQQKTFIKAQVDQGIAHRRNLLNIESVIASEERLLVDAQNQVDITTLKLMQSMGMPGNELIEIQESDVSNLLNEKPESFEELSAQAKMNLPEFRILNNHYTQNAYKIKSINAQRYPSLGVDGIIGTRTSTLVNQKNAEQLSNNTYQYMGLNLKIPIFYKNFYRNSIRIADLNLKDIELAQKQMALEIDQSILAAQLNINSSLKMYAASLKQLDALHQEYIYAEKLFKIGTINVVEYGDVRNRYIISQSRCLQDKYDYVIKAKVLDYYKGLFINNF